MARIRVTTRTAQQPEAVIEPLQKIGKAQRRHACGREFQCERNAIEPSADGAHQWRVRFGQLKSSIRGRRSLGKQHHARVMRGLTTRNIRRRHRQRRESVDELTGNAKGSLAGHQCAQRLGL